MIISRKDRIILRRVLENEVSGMGEADRNVMLVMLALLQDIEEIERKISQDPSTIEDKILFVLQKMVANPHAVHADHVRAFSLLAQQFASFSERVWSVKLLLDSLYPDPEQHTEPRSTLQ